MHAFIQGGQTINKIVDFAKLKAKFLSFYELNESIRKFQIVPWFSPIILAKPKKVLNFFDVSLDTKTTFKTTVFSLPKMPNPKTAPDALALVKNPVHKLNLVGSICLFSTRTERTQHVFAFDIFMA